MLKLFSAVLLPLIFVVRLDEFPSSRGPIVYSKPAPNGLWVAFYSMFCQKYTRSAGHDLPLMNCLSFWVLVWLGFEHIIPRMVAYTDNRSTTAYIHVRLYVNPYETCIKESQRLVFVWPVPYTSSAYLCHFCFFRFYFAHYRYPTTSPISIILVRLLHFKAAYIHMHIYT